MTLNELAAWFADKDDIVIIGHVAPDGDSVGTALALKHAFAKMGKRACVALADKVPDKYMFLNGADEICRPDSLPFAPKCAFAVDVSEHHRMGSAAEIFDAAQHKANLDHHETNPGFGDAFHVQGDRASAGEIAMEFIHELGAEVDSDIAECIFVAVCTDTGNFNFKNTDKRAYAAAAECVENGADVEKLTRRAFRERSLAATKLLGDALARVATAYDGRIAYTYVDETMLENAGAKLEDASRISNYMNEITGVKVGLYFERRNGATKVSWRCACGINVAEIAAVFGGGGHSAAAGATINADMQTAIEMAVKATEEALKGFEGGC